jgi:nitroreductase
MHQGLPHDSTIRTAIELACRAPSLHNTQPWLLRIGHETIHLYADPSRRLPATDPQGRDLLVSCGALLHHLRTAFLALGWATTVHRLPNPEAPDHLAALELRPVETVATMVRASGAIERRRTDRRRYAPIAPSPELIAMLGRHAAAEGAQLRPLAARTSRERLIFACQEATVVQATNVEYVAELRDWSGERIGARSGVPSANVPRSLASQGDFPARPFWSGELIQPHEANWRPDEEMLAILGTVQDDRQARLRAGEALSSVLLAATATGLTSCPISHPMEVATTRAFIYEELLGRALHPQVIVRVGWPPVGGAPVPRTPRRPIEEFVSYQEI